MSIYRPPCVCKPLILKMRRSQYLQHFPLFYLNVVYIWIVKYKLDWSEHSFYPWQKGKIKPVHVVDVPGHSRLRPKLDEFLPQAAGIVFVVDALEFLPNCRAASEYLLATVYGFHTYMHKYATAIMDSNLWCFICKRYLYDILTKSSVVKKKIPVLILCNKTDKVTAHTKEFIRKQLEKEMYGFNLPYFWVLAFWITVIALIIPANNLMEWVTPWVLLDHHNLCDSD